MRAFALFAVALRSIALFFALLRFALFAVVFVSRLLGLLFERIFEFIESFRRCRRSSLARVLPVLFARLPVLFARVLPVLFARVLPVLFSRVLPVLFARLSRFSGILRFAFGSLELLGRLFERLLIFFRQFIVAKLLLEIVDEVFVLLQCFFELRIGRVDVFGQVAKHARQLFELFLVFRIGAIEQIAQYIGGFVVVVLFERLGDIARFGVFFHLRERFDGIANRFIDRLLLFARQHFFCLIFELLFECCQTPFVLIGCQFPRIVVG